MSTFEPKPFGKYFLMEKLAVGGMAEIYKAKTFGVDGFEKQLAIKKILPHCSADKEFIAMLSDEAKLVVRLSHTNIVQIFDLGKVGDDYFISMEFIDGVNLRELLNRAKDLGEKLPLPICLYVASEVCKGLDYAHSKRDENSRPLHIVHRDISPQNILISFEGETKIVDFGIAKAAMNMSQTSAGILKGKVNYMSPEQALGKIVDQHTDTFSAGLVLFELLTGQRFFSGETQFHVLKQIQTSQITAASLPTSIPEDIRTILAKALAYNPAERYETASDFQIALTKLLYTKYVDFSSKQLSLLVQKWFEPELKKRRQSVEALSPISTQTRLAMSQSMSESIVHREPLTPPSKLQLMETTKPEGEERAQFIRQLEPDQASLSLSSIVPKKSGRNWIIFFIIFILTLSVSGFFITKSFKPKPPTVVTLLNISSTPEGADILINGEPTEWITPAQIEKLEPNTTVLIQLEKEGFKLWEQSMPLTTETQNIQANLEPITIQPEKFSLMIKSDPPGASITINNNLIDGKTPFELGNHDPQTKLSIGLSLEGYEMTTQEVLVDKPLTEFFITLNPVPKVPVPEPVIKKTTLMIESNVPDTQVYIDGVKKGTAPVSMETSPGNFKVKLEKKGYLPLEKDIIVEEGKDHAFSLQLEKKPEPVVEPKKPIENTVKPPIVPTPTPTPPVIKTTDDSTFNQGKNGAGNVRIDSLPRGAAVVFNGKKAGITPIVIPSVSLGSKHTVTLSKPGYNNWNYSFTLNKNYLEVSAPLTRGP